MTFEQKFVANTPKKEKEEGCENPKPIEVIADETKELEKKDFELVQAHQAIKSLAEQYAAERLAKEIQKGRTQEEKTGMKTLKKTLASILAAGIFAGSANNVFAAENRTSSAQKAEPTEWIESEDPLYVPPVNAHERIRKELGMSQEKDSAYVSSRKKSLRDLGKGKELPKSNLGIYIDGFEVAFEIPLYGNSWKSVLNPRKMAEAFKKDYGNLAGGAELIIKAILNGTLREPIREIEEVFEQRPNTGTFQGDLERHFRGKDLDLRNTNLREQKEIIEEEVGEAIEKNLPEIKEAIGENPIINQEIDAAIRSEREAKEKIE